MPLDRRLHVFRADLADEKLRGRVEAARFVPGIPAQLTVPLAGLRPVPDLAAGIDTEILHGETLHVFERANGWAWVQADADRYAGYLPESAIGAVNPPTHIVTAPRSFLYPTAELRAPPVAALSMGSRLRLTGEAENRGTRYLTTQAGQAVIAAHCRTIAEIAPQDHVAVAQRFLETPYLWGGRSGFGIDCSGLVQLSLAMVGKAALRDTDMQAASLGTAIAREALTRGDLVFWKGHVGIMEDERVLLHASGHSMTVCRERLEDAIGRIARLHALPSGFRRP